MASHNEIILSNIQNRESNIIHLSIEQILDIQFMNKISTLIKQYDSVCKLIIDLCNIYIKNNLNILFDSLKNSINLHTLKILNFNVKYNLNNLPQMLIINKSIQHINLELTIHDINHFIILVDAMKKHNILTNINLSIIDIRLNNITPTLIVESLQNQEYLQKITLYCNKQFDIDNCKNLANTIDKLKYIEFINLFGIRIESDIILKSLINKDLQLLYLPILNCTIDIEDLIKIIDTNNNLKYLYIPYSYTYNNELLKSLVKHNQLEIFKCQYCNIELYNIINSQTINKLDIFIRNETEWTYLIYLFDKLKTNTTITHLYIFNIQYIDFNLSYACVNTNIEKLCDLLRYNTNIVSFYLGFALTNNQLIQIFNNLIYNNTLCQFIVYNINYDDASTDEFVDSLCNLIIHNHSLYNIKIISLGLIDINELTIEHYKKIKDAINKNDTLIYFYWNVLMEFIQINNIDDIIKI